MNLHWTSLCMLGLLGCSSEQGTVYFVGVNVDGTEAAFAGRQVEVQGRILPPAAEQGSADVRWHTGAEFCTNSEIAFLNQPLKVRVLSGSEVVSEQSVVRVCRRVEMQEEYTSEYNGLVLEEDGTISSDYTDVRAGFSACGDTFMVPSTCDDDLFASN